jgi:hypothetical protein
LFIKLQLEPFVLREKLGDFGVDRLFGLRVGRGVALFDEFVYLRFENFLFGFGLFLFGDLIFVVHTAILLQVGGAGIKKTRTICARVFYRFAEVC